MIRLARRSIVVALGGGLGGGSWLTGQSQRAAVIRPHDWNGFDTTGTHDNAAIFQQLGTSVPVEGGVIAFPPGRIATSAACLIPGRTTVTGTGEATEIMCLPNFVAPRAAFLNRAWTSGGGEVGITIRDLRITGSEGLEWADAHFIAFQNAACIRVDRVGSRGWGGCTALSSCQNTEVSNCIAERVSNCGFDHWGGSGYMRVTNNLATVIAGIAGSFGIMVTGIRTDQSPAQTASGVIIGNQVIILGGTDEVRLGSCIEINAGDDGGAASVRDVIVGSNICEVRNAASHRGIHLAQTARCVQVRGNILRGGRFGPAITATGPGPSVIARDCVVDGNIIADWTTAPSQVAVISWWGLHSSVINNRGYQVSAPFTNDMDTSNYQDGNFAA
jgi:hypothetical protein